ncbi:MAG TPA: NAD(P)H-dependent glycerol-3-phosphate dehydrogenase [Terriglobia bacterium]|nr:NAD(P)H-dependent glycerol-3-phosphate dehydrogenase [Terriglobia bacterium]
MIQIAVIGAGSWGTALSNVLAKAGHPVRLWVYEPELAEQIRKNRVNNIYLPGFAFHPGVEVSHSLEFCLNSAEIVVSVVPSQYCRGLYHQMLPHIQTQTIFVSATKGIECETFQTMSSVINEVLSPRITPRIAVISGPSFAREVARGDPTAVVVASREKDVSELIQRIFSGPTWRLYSSTDVVGVELGGAVKNVIAIAAGVCAGLGFGSNTIAALITRGLAEMTRLALACGGRRETLAGLAGLGDLVLTCMGELSRNRSVGLKLGQGQRLAEILNSTPMVAEGVMTTRATVELARRFQVEMPITEQMELVLYHDKPPLEAIRDLMERRLKEE